MYLPSPALIVSTVTPILNINSGINPNNMHRKRHYKIIRRFVYVS